MQKPSLLIIGRGYVAGHIESAAREHAKNVDKGHPFFSIASSTRYHPIETASRIADIPESSWVVNATGYCGVSNVDDCELEPAKTWYANHAIAVHIAELCAHYEHKLLHISSGCIFNTAHEVQTITAPSPVGIYQASKAAAEHCVARIMEDREHIIARIRMPFSNTDCRRNYLSKFITHQKIWHSPRYSMSHIPEMAGLMVDDMLDMGDSRNRGTVHYVNKGVVSNSDLVGFLYTYDMIPIREMATPSKPRSYAHLTPHPRASSIWDKLVETVETWKWR